MEHFDKRAIDAKLAEGFPFTHRWHNRFHLEMPFGLINDPNGMTCHNGAYHIFYQWNPFGCAHKNKSWAHTKTRDFCTYQIPQLALWPTDEHDKDGCYSGCGTEEDGHLRVLYTCNAKDEQGNRSSVQRFGTYTKAAGAVKKEEIIIDGPPAGFTAHFRDPYLFERHGVRHLIIGAQTQDERGCVLVYREAPIRWECLGELRTQLKDFGYMWECPNLLSFGDSDVLVFCPQGVEARAYDRQNVYQAGYIAGHASMDAMEMLMHGRFKELDHGFDFYAPQVLTHEGRHVLIGWMGMPDREEDYPTREEGWMHSLTLPRVLTLRQGHIFSEPVRELKALRHRETERTLEAEGESEFSATLYDLTEFILDLTMGEAHTVSVELVFGLEKLVFRYNRLEQVMTIDRTGMKLGGRGKRIFKLYAEDTLSMRVYVDHGAVEAFFQHGEEAAAIAIFPEKNIQPTLRVFSDVDMRLLSGVLWELEPFHYEAVGTV